MRVSTTVIIASSYLSFVSAQNVTTAPSATTTAAQTLLPVPTYGMTQPYDNSTAKNLAQYLPPYTYNLTSESNATKTAICAQTVQFCASAQCTKSGANVTENFCNPETMGWNCECNDGAQSRLQANVVPVNSYDCRLRALACLDACQDRNTSVPIPSIPNCVTACNYVLGSTCGTNSQIIPEYKVGSYNDKPKYYPNTSKGGVALGITTSFAVRTIGDLTPTLTVASLIGSLYLLL